MSSLNPGAVGWIVPSGVTTTRKKRQAAVLLPNHEAVKQMLREIRTRAGLSQQQVAERMGASQPAIVGCERDVPSERVPRVPSAQWLARFAEACGARVIIEFPDEDV